MIKVERYEAQAVLGGTLYTWIHRERYDSTRCVYDRYKHDKDKYGRETSSLYYDGSEVLSCKRGKDFSGTSVQTASS